MEKLKQKSVSEIVAVAAFKAAKNKSKATVFVPYPFLPPTKPYKVVREETAFGPVEILTLPKEGGWLCKVRFLDNKGGFTLKEVAKLS